MDIKNIAITKLSEEVLLKFLESLKSKFGFFDMYYNLGPRNCFCTEKFIVVIISESNYSDRGGGIERNNSIKLYDHQFQLIAQSPEVNYRHRSEQRRDNYHNEYQEILEVLEGENVLSVKVKTGEGGDRFIGLVAEEKSKQNGAKEE